MSVRILIGDARDRLLALPDESVHCIVTSPPYFGLRDYGVDGQIGLEPTPDAYVGELVALFREARRVLRADGTLWLNLGDSYAGSWGAQGHRITENDAPSWHSSQIKNHPKRGKQIGTIREAGLKPKDLIGIPWRVARALQEPYYTGRVKSELDRVWLAAMIDAEGCIFIHKRKAGQSNGQGYERKSDTYGAGLEVANCSEAVTDRCLQIAGIGSIFKHEKDRRQPLFRWQLRSNECRDIVREVYPYLVAKKHQARLLLSCPSSGPKAEAAHASLIALHGGGQATIDFPEPASMYEQGWYLRQDIIWAKSNPMPESVTDRCTKAHEYLFLLSKSERYHYDAKAIAEPSIDPESLNGRNKRNDDKFAKHDPAGLARTRAGFSAIDAGKIYATRNKRSVWTVTTQPYGEAHFATFPPALIEPCILAGCPEGGTVLDPFGGAGTTGLVADRLGRNAILIELNPAYAEMAENRIRGDAGMMAEVHRQAFGEPA